MATDPEAQAQLARLLRDESLRTAPPDTVRNRVEAGFDLLVEGLVAEVAASDDVTDHESGLSFVRLRLEVLESVLTPSQSSRLYEAVREKIEAW